MRHEKGNILLVELLIVILFFTLSQVIVLQAFVKAQQLNREAGITNLALLRAEDTAETLAVSDNAEETLASLGFTATDGLFQAESEDGYRITAEITHFTQTTGVLTTVTVKAFRDMTELFALPAVRYREVSAQ
ncbi:MAG TPA: hypothetical protein PKJ47_09695 [Candidatus Limiplasma sp.]|nr:hypothetical protein [Candidatus Limiplasma sp.]